MQMILILTKSVNRCFEKNSKFDMTPLLGGTDVVFSSLIHSFSWFVLCSHSLLPPSPSLSLSLYTNLHHDTFYFLFDEVICFIIGIKMMR